MTTFDFTALRLARKKAGIRQSEAAKALGVTTGTLGSWENGRKDIPARKLNILLQLYNIRPEELFIIKPPKLASS